VTDRYNRHNLIEWFSQDHLAHLSAIVIGAGAVGNEVLKNLALLGVGKIRVVDFDRIEEHNLTRSVLFRPSDVGSLKAEVAARETALLDENISVSGQSGDFWDILSFDDLRSADVVYCCVDNFEARIRSNTLCHLLGVDLVNIGIDSRFAGVEIFPFSRLPSSACFECHLPSSVYQRIASRYSCGSLKKLSLIERKIPTTIVTSSVAAAIGVSKGLRLGQANVDACAERVMIDTITGASTTVALDRVGGCPGCGQLPGHFQILTSRREIGPLGSQFGSDAVVVASEPILASYRVGDREELVFRRASEFDDSFRFSISAAGDAALEVRDQFTVGEIAGRFSFHRMPTKFAVVRGATETFVLEFKET
jgi:molybdopterin/thiamine biosynthesis adenylyltransferase